MIDQVDRRNGADPVKRPGPQRGDHGLGADDVGAPHFVCDIKSNEVRLTVTGTPEVTLDWGTAGATSTGKPGCRGWT